MDPRFAAAIEAIKTNDADRLRQLVEAEPSLATAHSSCGHPNLLQCLVLEGAELSRQAEMISILVERGADLHSALVAAVSMDNATAAELLLDAGAALEGTGGWSPLEEALYWRNQAVTELLLARGASILNLRCAAALGRIDLIDSFFSADGTLTPDAGVIDWPFGDPHTSGRPAAVKRQLEPKVDGWTRDSQAVLNNAFVYACMHDQIEAAKLLLERGAQINAFPEGFDFDGTGLHYAAMNGHREMVELLLQRGADASLRDPKVGSTPAGWAAHGEQPELAERLSPLEAAA